MTSTEPAGRPVLRGDELRDALVIPGGFWRDVRVVAETGSTNADLLGEASRGLEESTVLVAGSQAARRGAAGQPGLGAAAGRRRRRAGGPRRNRDRGVPEVAQ